MSAKSEAFKAVFTKANINVSNISVLGAWVHVDTFNKYEGTLRDLMGNAGFDLVSKSDGIHMDEYRGFRMVFKIRD